MPGQTKYDLNINVRVVCRPISQGGKVPTTAQVIEDLRNQCIDMLTYQHKDNEDALVKVESAT